MKKIRDFVVKLLLRFIGGRIYKRLNRTEILEMMDNIVQKDEREQFVAFLENSAEEAKNKYLYTSDPIYKGMSLAFLSFKETIMTHYRNSKKEDKKTEAPKRGTAY